jgi:hypothetical protein
MVHTSAVREAIDARNNVVPIFIVPPKVKAKIEERS